MTAVAVRLSGSADITFAIGEVAEMIGISPHTIRAWERRHVVVRPSRTVSGQRRYTPDEVEVLRQIKHGRHVHGFSLRVATLTAQGVVVPDAGDSRPVDTAAVVCEDGDPLRVVTDLVSEVVVVIDPDGRIVHANAAFVALSGMPLDQLRGAAFADFVQPDDHARAAQAHRAPLRQRRDWELGLRTARRESLFSFGCWPVASAGGPVVVLVGRDLTAPPATGRLHDERPSPVRGGAGAAAQLGELLDGVADPVRTLRVVRRWLDGTHEAVALAGAGEPLTVLYANRACRRLTAAATLPDDGGRLAAEAAAAIRSGQPRRVSGLRVGGAGEARAIWDVDLRPVAGAGGGVGHLVLVIADVTAETAVASRLDAMLACAGVIRQPSEPHRLVRLAAPHARDLLPNAGSLLAVTDPGGDAVNVVATSGGCAPGGGEHDLRLALVRDAIRTRTSIEVERVGAARGTVETLRIVPLLAAARALGALGYLRAGASAFSSDDRQLIDELAGRLGLALARIGRWPG